jgi:hypothetical protein
VAVKERAGGRNRSTVRGKVARVRCEMQDAGCGMRDTPEAARKERCWVRNLIPYPDLASAAKTFSRWFQLEDPTAVRYAIVSDIHGNLQAWMAVLDDIREPGRR